MTFLDIFRLIVLFGMLGWVSYTDLKDGKIPNTATVTGMIVGVIVALLDGLLKQDGGQALINSIEGLVIGAGPLLLAYLLGISIRKPLMGAGDVKLMAAIGAITGPMAQIGPIFGWWCLFYGLIISGVFGIVAILFCLLTNRPIPKKIALGACLAFGTAIAIVNPQFGMLFRPTIGL